MEMHKDLHSHQVTDEIKQREIYDAYMNHVPVDQIKVADHLVSPNIFFDLNVQQSDEFAYLKNLEKEYKQQADLKDEIKTMLQSESKTVDYNPI